MDLENDGDPLLMFGPPTESMHTTILTLYNSSYASNDLLGCLNGFNPDAWLLIVATSICLTLLFRAYTKDAIDSLFCAFGLFVEKPLTRKVVHGLRSPHTFMIGVILAMIYCVIIIYGNTIRSSATVKVNTKTFDDVDDLVTSDEYTPIWCKGLVNARYFEETDPFFLKAS